ncbi:hypothetical protein B6D60_01445 [candidate division KSB1 bacterium 4484_87]|nr:MAG: hypothetical protein B6D60_01445 [candidate division KSB1 bacterium 4484_87]
MIEEIIFEYQSLIHKIEQKCSLLEDHYREHLVCRPGCSQCCQVERSVLSIEAYFVEQHLKTFSAERIRKMRLTHKNNSDNYCPMLWHDMCAIYPVRPIICRTHGLPILYVEAEIAFVDYCRLNFTQLSETYEFDEKYIVDMREFNSELVRLDQKFTQDILHLKWDPYRRISLNSILFDKKVIS